MNRFKVISLMAAGVGFVCLYAGTIQDEVPMPKSVAVKNVNAQVVEQKIQLFMYDACPYCVKVTDFLKQHNLMDKVEFIDADILENRELLRSFSGRTQAPYLIDVDANISMPESLDIIVYLAKKFSVIIPTFVDTATAVMQADFCEQKKYDSVFFLSDVKASKKPVIILVSTTWCPPCQQFKPVFKMVAEQMKDSCEFIMLDGDLDKDIATQLQVRAYPTVICYKDGNRIDPINYRTKAGLLEVISQLLQE